MAEIALAVLVGCAVVNGLVAIGYYCLWQSACRRSDAWEKHAKMIGRLKSFAEGLE